VLLAFGVAIAIYTSPNFDGELAVPFFKNFTPNIGWLYVPLATFIIVAASNAVNLTDGLDARIGPYDLRGDLPAASGRAASPSTSRSRTSPARASSRSSAARWSEAASGSCGSTRRRRSSSWATSGRSPWAARSARSPS
jgi:hypothetical protein